MNFEICGVAPDLIDGFSMSDTVSLWITVRHSDYIQYICQEKIRID